VIAVELLEDEVVELVELLGLLGELCGAHHHAVSAALEAMVGPGYDASELGADARRLGEALARAVGLVGEAPCPHPHLFADMECAGPRLAPPAPGPATGW